MMRATRFAEQRGNRHGDGEISFAGAGRAHAEHQIVAFDRFQVAALVHRLGRQHLLAEIALAAALHQGAEAHFGIFGNHAEIAVQIAIVEDVPFADERDVIFQDVFGARYRFGFAFDFQAGCR